MAGRDRPRGQTSVNAPTLAADASADLSTIIRGDNGEGWRRVSRWQASTCSPLRPVARKPRSVTLCGRSSKSLHHAID